MYSYGVPILVFLLGFGILFLLAYFRDKWVNEGYKFGYEKGYTDGYAEGLQEGKNSDGESSLGMA